MPNPTPVAQGLGQRGGGSARQPDCYVFHGHGQGSNVRESDIFEILPSFCDFEQHFDCEAVFEVRNVKKTRAAKTDFLLRQAGWRQGQAARPRRQGQVARRGGKGRRGGKAKRQGQAATARPGGKARRLNFESQNLSAILPQRCDKKKWPAGPVQGPGPPRAQAWLAAKKKLKIPAASSFQKNV